MRKETTEFWGKAQAEGAFAAGMHPAVAHSLDVAAVATLLPRIAEIGLPGQAVGFLAAIHDVGKFSRPFQSLAMPFWPDAVLGPPPGPMGQPGARHDVMGMHLLRKPLARLLDPAMPPEVGGRRGWNDGARGPLLRAIAGHHGRPPTVLPVDPGPAELCPACLAAAADFVTSMHDLFGRPVLPWPLTDRQVAQLGWGLAGLVTLADWIGSRQSWFPYVAPKAVVDPAAYLWNHALPRAAAAIAAAGLARAAPAPFRGITGLFPAIVAPSPVQRWAESVRLPPGPVLAVIEDLTGSGKTEAAVTLAHRLLAEGRAGGVFLALPTMATANAMFGRLADAYRGLFAAEAHPSLALAHARAALDPRFLAAIPAEPGIGGHGATTILFGNCGVGFAPVRARDRKALIDLMEGVEDIPGITLTEGLKWDWESFPEYLDSLARLPRTIDIGAQVAHHPLRVFVMGERGLNREAATHDDIDQMARLTEEALRAGAFGFTTSRTDQHKTTNGDLTPARYAEEQELLAIGRAMGRAGSGAFGMLSDFEDEAAEFRWLRQVAAESGRPVWFLLTDRAYDPQRWRRLMDGVRSARADGLALSAQVAARPVGLVLGLTTSLNPFALRESFAALAHLSPAAQLQRLRDPAMRATILAEEPSPRLLEVLPPLSRAIASRFDKMFAFGDPPDYEPPPERSMAAMAAAAGVPADAFAFDYLVGGDGGRMLYFPVVNYAPGDLSVVREMITDPHTVVGLSDGGAHCGVICDASMTTFMLTHWARDRTRGEKLPLEFVVKRQTSETADFFGLTDRGRLAPGLKADVNVIDFANLRLHHPEMIYDLPAGGRRLVQRVDGYDMTIVSGVPVMERGQVTAARPGVLVRAGR